MSINSIKLNFETDEIFNPLDVSVYELKESNRLIEEFMLLANMSVAKQIFEFFPEQALLRRHEQPLEKRMVDFISHMNKIGLDLDASSSGALQQSLDAIQDPDVRKVVRLLVIKPMQRAKYICTGMLSPEKYHHYALNAPLYTHFTSPIRRYADIIVHRMLEASLTGGKDKQPSLLCYFYNQLFPPFAYKNFFFSSKNNQIQNFTWARNLVKRVLTTAISRRTPPNWPRSNPATSTSRSCFTT